MFFVPVLGVQVLDLALHDIMIDFDDPLHFLEIPGDILRCFLPDLRFIVVGSGGDISSNCIIQTRPCWYVLLVTDPTVDLISEAGG